MAKIGVKIGCKIVVLTCKIEMDFGVGEMKFACSAKDLGTRITRSYENKYFAKQLNKLFRIALHKELSRHF